MAPVLGLPRNLERGPSTSVLRLLHESVDRAASRSPDSEAIRVGGESISYATLASRSSRLAEVLRAEGVRLGDRVAIHADKGVAAATALYGIMKAGAAYVPLDPHAPVARQAFILNDCGVRHLVTEPSRKAQLSSLLAEPNGVEMVLGCEGLERSPVRALPWAEVEGAPEGPLSSISPDDLSYILYTSGSTGTPKGVTHTHRSALAFAQVAADVYGFGPQDRLSNHAPLHFDLSTMDYFSAAIAGATTVVIPEAYTKFPASLSRLIERDRVTVLYMVPLALTHLLLHGALHTRDLSSVRWVLFGGEPFPPRHLRNLMAAMPGARFSNVYGPTEVNGVTYWFVPELPDDVDDAIPIGDVFDGVTPRIVDERFEPVERASPGELLVRTPTMMRGYWNRPDLDARAFWPTPEAEGRFYRTGDLVRRRGDGLLDFLGRIDRQIKSRGYRIELDEIEVALLRDARVASAAAFGVREPQGSMGVEAAIVAHPGHSLDEADVRHGVARFLPPYMVPERIRILGALPLTSSGKIDRVKLSAQSEREGPAGP